MKLQEWHLAVIAGIIACCFILGMGYVAYQYRLANPVERNC